MKMELASTKEVFERVAPVSRTRPIATTNSRGRLYVIVAIVGLAIGLRLYGITTYPLFGDEYNSIAAALDVNLNWNSILYALLTHFLIRLGDTEFWLRLPAVIFGVASVPVLFRIGERVGGSRCAIACGLIAAVSPFNIFHSQEMRFYSLFILASAIFLLGTIHYVDRVPSVRSRLLLVLSGVFLILSHFLGILALCAQATAALFASSRISRRLRAAVLASFAVLIGAPLIPFVQHRLWDFYSAHAGVTDFSRPPFNGLSLTNLAKLAYAIFTFALGYHVYPLRLGLVIFGLGLFGFLLCVGSVKLWKRSEWRMLPITYLLALVAVFFVLDSVGGRVSSVIGPRHVAFVWPVFVLLTAFGLTAFNDKLFVLMLTAIMGVSGAALWLGWQRDWSPGSVPDYRAAAAYATQWTDEQTSFVIAGRSNEPFAYYFPKHLRMADLDSYLKTSDLNSLGRNRRLIFASDQWSEEGRRGIDHSLRHITAGYTLVDGRVDYPLFEYVYERKVPEESSASADHTRALQFPMNIYGLEFQDLKLPVTVAAQGVTLNVFGAAQLPNPDEETVITISLAPATRAEKLVLLSNVTGDHLPAPGGIVAELSVEDNAGRTTTMPIRMGMETAPWDQTCQAGANCQSAFQWHKRMAIAARHGYAGAWRDFPAQMHAASFVLPKVTEVRRVSIRYRAESGRLYIWGAAVA